MRVSRRPYSRIGLFALAAASALACTPRPEMCATPAACGVGAACVAGRCQREGAGTPEIGAPGGRRVVASPVALAYVRRGGPSSSPAVATLGREGDGAMLLLRFALALPRGARIVEAYLVLTREDAMDADPVPVSLHLARILEPWTASPFGYALAPRIDDARAPSSVARASGAASVRLDARALVERWAQHDRADQGVAVLAGNETPTGLGFACGAGTPTLEVYLR